MAISIVNAVKRFEGKPAVDGVTVAIEDGSFFVVLGASGCGKSTLLRLIAGLEHLDEGEISLQGAIVADEGRHIAPERRNVGMVFQSYALWPHMSVAGNVAFPIETDGRSRAQARAKAQEHLATVALAGFEDRLPASLSGGQRQRVALARCLAQGAKTVLMDEPLANLDPHLRATMEDELAAFHRASGATTIYITHDQREAMALADRMAVMDKGRFLQVGTPEEIYREPANETVARFIGQSTIVDVMVDGVSGVSADVTAIGVPLTARCRAGTSHGSARMVVRPENITPVIDGAFSGSVAAISYRGGHYEAWVRAGETVLPVHLPVKANEGDVFRFDIKGAWILPN